MPRPNPSLLVTAVIWGFNFVALKLLYRHMTPQAVSLVRFALMYAVMVGLSRVMRQPLRVLPGDLGRVVFVGFLSMGVYMALFLQGMGGTGAGEGAIILATSPIFTAWFAVLLKQERFSPLALVGAAIAIVGVAVVVGSSGGSSGWVGPALVFTSAVVWAYGAVLTREMLKRYSPVVLLTLTMPGGLLVLVPFGIHDVLNVRFGTLTGIDWALIAFIAALAGAVGFVGFYRGVQQVGAGSAMLYQYLTPIFAAVFGYFVLGRALGPLQWIGMAVVLVGVAIASTARANVARAAAS